MPEGAASAPPAAGIGRAWSAQRGGLLSVSAQAGAFVLRFLATLVLARLLTPVDYGVYTVAAALLAGFALFKDLGLGAAAVQRSEVTRGLASTLFWVNAGIGLGLSLAAAALSPLAGRVFGDLRVGQACLGLAVVPLLDGLGVQPVASLKRRLRLGALAAIDAAAVLLGVLLAIASARAGAGFWALVAMHTSIAGVTAAAAWLASGLRPGVPGRGHGLRHLLRFGSHVTLLGVSSYVTRNADTLLIGWALGPRPLGLYDKAYQLMQTPAQLVTQPLAGVAISVLSRLQDDAVRYRRHYRELARMASNLALPATAFLVVTADRLLPFLLGPQWIPSVPVFRALAAAAFFDALATSAGWIYMSLGRAGRQVGFSLAASFLTVAALTLALPWGVVGVAWTFSACRGLLCLPAIVWACRESPVTWHEPLRWSLPAVVASLGAAGLCGALGLPSAAAPAVVALAVAASVFVSVHAALWLLGCWIWRRDI